MRVKSKPVSALNQQAAHCSSPRTRKKHKRLDAICESTYTQNHSPKRRAEGGAADDEGEVRRSLRVRRAPAILDVSPPPPKRRKKSGRISEKSLSAHMKEEEDEDCDAQPLGRWKSRLRSRENCIRFGRGGNVKSLKGKRKLFEDNNSHGEEMKEKVLLEEEDTDSDRKDEEEEKIPSNELVGEQECKSSTLEKSRSIEKVYMRKLVRTNSMPANTKKEEVKVTEAAGDEEEKGNLALYEEKENEVSKVGSRVFEPEPGLMAANETCIRAEGESDNAALAVEAEEKMTAAVCVEKRHTEFDSVVAADQIVEPAEGGNDAPSESNDKEVDELLVDRVAEFHGTESGFNNNFVNGDEKSADFGNTEKVNVTTQHSTKTLGYSRVKAGRRCALCGGGTDGKPPNKLNELGESENETHNGSPASEGPNYDIWDGFGDEPGWLGRLLGPINDRYGIAGIWVHQHCAVWSPEV